MIEVRHLRKEYDQTVALDNLRLEIPEGEVYGLIGPNGAGKTTLIRVLATLLEPTYGQVRIAGVSRRNIIAIPTTIRPPNATHIFDATLLFLIRFISISFMRSPQLF